MPTSGAFQFGLPRFQGAVRSLVLLNIAVWITVLLLWTFDRPDALLLLHVTGLSSATIREGWIWQFLTYGFIHMGPSHIFGTMLGTYFIGSAVEERTGRRAFFELYLFSLITSGIVGFGLSFIPHIGGGVALGAGAAANALTMIFYLFYRTASIYLFPFPFQIPVKWVVVILAAIETGYLVYTDFSLMVLVSMLGLGTGYLWYRYMWRRATVTASVQTQVFSIRNAYYRWKRRRAARKFQVYMSKHQQDPKKYFDEYGNFKPPDDSEKKNGGGKGGWVN